MSAYEFAKNGLFPGTLGLLLLGLAIGLAALRSTRSARFGTVTLAGFTAGYWAMSLPVGAWLLGRIVSVGYSPVDDPSTLAGVQAIVVLDASTVRYERDGEELAVASAPSAVRALEAVRLYRMIQPVLVVVTSGSYTRVGKMPEGGAIREVLLTAGVPASRMVLDSESRNTREHAANVSNLLRARGVSRFALVTSSVHMRRAMRAFSSAGLQVVPAPAPLAAPERFAWWPVSAALDRSWEAWYEVFGLLRDLVAFSPDGRMPES